MTQQEWGRIKTIFDACLDLDPEERRKYLDNSCQDSETRAEVESLLASYEQAGDFIERAALDESLAGRCIGAWEIICQVGEGGIGRVYRARRTSSEFEQVAALKLLKLGVDSEEISRHFFSERRILATLDHPGIARLIDGGITEDGRPYFVMEFVEGVLISDFVAARHLGPKQITALMRQVCNAVDYAHRRLVVHRDLKPGNVMVTASGEVKLLDFGIAKILGPQETRTATGVRLLTPEYASPEQLRGEPVTTGSDVYALGVMLYRLLAKRSPYRTSGSELAMAIAMEREDIAKPSAVSSTGPSTRELAGDLDTIVMKALEFDAARRYASAGEFAADLLRYESGYPILARPQTLRYRLHKLVARNRLAAAAAALAIVAVVVGLGTSLWEARVARSERRQAEKRYNEVRRLANSLLFDVHDAVADVAGATKARALVIARAVEYLDTLLTDVPADSTVRLEVANAYIRLGDVQGYPANSNLGDHGAAERDYRKALALLEPLVARDAGPGVQRALATAYGKLGGLDNAKRSLAIRETLLRAHPDDLVARNELGRAYFAVGFALVDKKEYPQALEWFQLDLNIMRELMAAKPDMINLSQNYGQALKHAGAVLVVLKREPEALKMYEEALRVDEERATKNAGSLDAQMDISFSESDIGLIYWRQQRFAEAIRHYQRAVTIRKNIRTRDPDDDRARRGLWSASARLGAVYLQSGDRRRGIEWLIKAEQEARPPGQLSDADTSRLTEWIRSCSDLAIVYRENPNQTESVRWTGRTEEGYRELERRNEATPVLRELVAKLRTQQGTSRPIP